ncbi:MAG: CRISPR-associated protein Csx16 [Proteobacteria bacterium]|nr:CRISPR-associated protein Csx16 [Pseudomonadota bacterium]
MATYFISRHPGAIDWARAQGIDAQWVRHLDLASVQSGDSVLGTLPIHLAAGVCERGARYVHLELDLPAQLRGCELDLAAMQRLSPRLVGYRVLRETNPVPAAGDGS